MFTWRASTDSTGNDAAATDGAPTRLPHPSSSPNETFADAPDVDPCQPAALGPHPQETTSGQASQSQPLHSSRQNTQRPPSLADPAGAPPAAPSQPLDHTSSRVADTDGFMTNTQDAGYEMRDTQGGGSSTVRLSRNEWHGHAPPPLPPPGSPASPANSAPASAASQHGTTHVPQRATETVGWVPTPHPVTASSRPALPHPTLDAFSRGTPVVSPTVAFGYADWDRMSASATAVRPTAETSPSQFRDTQVTQAIATPLASTASRRRFDGAEDGDNEACFSSYDRPSSGMSSAIQRARKASGSLYPEPASTGVPHSAHEGPLWPLSASLRSRTMSSRDLGDPGPGRAQLPPVHGLSSTGHDVHSPVSMPFADEGGVTVAPGYTSPTPFTYETFDTAHSPNTSNLTGARSASASSPAVAAAPQPQGWLPTPVLARQPLERDETAAAASTSSVPGFHLSQPFSAPSSPAPPSTIQDGTAAGATPSLHARQDSVTSTHSGLLGGLFMSSPLAQAGQRHASGFQRYHNPPPRGDKAPEGIAAPGRAVAAAGAAAVRRDTEASPTSPLMHPDAAVSTTARASLSFSSYGRQPSLTGLVRQVSGFGTTRTVGGEHASAAPAVSFSDASPMGSVPSYSISQVSGEGTGGVVAGSNSGSPLPTLVHSRTASGLPLGFTEMARASTFTYADYAGEPSHPSPSPLSGQPQRSPAASLLSSSVRSAPGVAVAGRRRSSTHLATPSVEVPAEFADASAVLLYKAQGWHNADEERREEDKNATAAGPGIMGDAGDAALDNNTGLHQLTSVKKDSATGSVSLRSTSAGPDGSGGGCPPASAGEPSQATAAPVMSSVPSTTTMTNRETSPADPTRTASREAGAPSHRARVDGTVRRTHTPPPPQSQLSSDVPRQNGSTRPSPSAASLTASLQPPPLSVVPPPTPPPPPIAAAPAGVMKRRRGAAAAMRDGVMRWVGHHLRRQPLAAAPSSSTNAQTAPLGSTSVPTSALNAPRGGRPKAWLQGLRREAGMLYDVYPDCVTAAPATKPRTTRKLSRFHREETPHDGRRRLLSPDPSPSGPYEEGGHEDDSDVSDADEKYHKRRPGSGGGSGDVAQRPSGGVVRSDTLSPALTPVTSNLFSHARFTSSPPLVPSSTPGLLTFSQHSRGERVREVGSESRGPSLEASLSTQAPALPPRTELSLVTIRFRKFWKSSHSTKASAITDSSRATRARKDVKTPAPELMAQPANDVALGSREGWGSFASSAADSTSTLPPSRVPIRGSGGPPPSFTISFPFFSGREEDASRRESLDGHTVTRQSQDRPCPDAENLPFGRRARHEERSTTRKPGSSSSVNFTYRLDDLSTGNESGDGLRQVLSFGGATNESGAFSPPPASDATACEHGDAANESGESDREDYLIPVDSFSSALALSGVRALAPPTATLSTAGPSTSYRDVLRKKTQGKRATATAPLHEASGKGTHNAMPETQNAPSTLPRFAPTNPQPLSSVLSQTTTTATAPTTVPGHHRPPALESTGLRLRKGGSAYANATAYAQNTGSGVILNDSFHSADRSLSSVFARVPGAALTAAAAAGARPNPGTSGMRGLSTPLDESEDRALLPRQHTRAPEASAASSLSSSSSSSLPSASFLRSRGNAQEGRANIRTSNGTTPPLPHFTSPVPQTNEGYQRTMFYTDAAADLRTGEPAPPNSTTTNVASNVSDSFLAMKGTLDDHADPPGKSMSAVAPPRAGEGPECEADDDYVTINITLSTFYARPLHFVKTHLKGCVLFSLLVFLLVMRGILLKDCSLFMPSRRMCHVLRPPVRSIHVFARDYTELPHRTVPHYAFSGEEAGRRADATGEPLWAEFPSSLSGPGPVAPAPPFAPLVAENGKPATSRGPSPRFQAKDTHANSERHMAGEDRSENEDPFALTAHASRVRPSVVLRRRVARHHAMRFLPPQRSHVHDADYTGVDWLRLHHDVLAGAQEGALSFRSPDGNGTRALAAARGRGRKALQQARQLLAEDEGKSYFLNSKDAFLFNLKAKRSRLRREQQRVQAVLATEMERRDGAGGPEDRDPFEEALPATRDVFLPHPPQGMPLRTRVVFMTAMNKTMPFSCLSQASAALAGIPIHYLNFLSPYNHVGRFDKYLEFIEQEKLHDDDVIVAWDSDIIFTGESAVPYLQEFIYASPRTRAEMDVVRIRTGQHAAPIVFPAEKDCMASQLFATPEDCVALYDGYEHQMQSEAHSYGFSYNSNLGGQRNPFRFLNGGTLVARVWAFRLLHEATRAFMQIRTPKHKKPYWFCDQTIVTALFVDSLRWELDQSLVQLMKLEEEVGHLLPPTSAEYVEEGADLDAATEEFLSAATETATRAEASDTHDAREDDMRGEDSAFVEAQHPGWHDCDTWTASQGDERHRAAACATQRLVRRHLRPLYHHAVMDSTTGRHHGASAGDEDDGIPFQTPWRAASHRASPRTAQEARDVRILETLRRTFREAVYQPFGIPPGLLSLDSTTGFSYAAGEHTWLREDFTATEYVANPCQRCGLREEESVVLQREQRLRRMRQQLAASIAVRNGGAAADAGFASVTEALALDPFDMADAEGFDFVEEDLALLSAPHETHTAVPLASSDPRTVLSPRGLEGVQGASSHSTTSPVLGGYQLTPQDTTTTPPRTRATAGRSASLPLTARVYSYGRWRERLSRWLDREEALLKALTSLASWQPEDTAHLVNGAAKRYRPRTASAPAAGAAAALATAQHRAAKDWVATMQRRSDMALDKDIASLAASEIGVTKGGAVFAEAREHKFTDVLLTTLQWPFAACLDFLSNFVTWWQPEVYRWLSRPWFLLAGYRDAEARGRQRRYDAGFLTGRDPLLDGDAAITATSHAPKDGDALATAPAKKRYGKVFEREDALVETVVGMPHARLNSQGTVMAPPMIELTPYAPNYCIRLPPLMHASASATSAVVVEEPHGVKQHKEEEARNEAVARPARRATAMTTSAPRMILDKEDFFLAMTPSAARHDPSVERTTELVSVASRVAHPAEVVAASGAEQMASYAFPHTTDRDRPREGRRHHHKRLPAYTADSKRAYLRRVLRNEFYVQLLPQELMTLGFGGDRGSQACEEAGGCDAMGIPKDVAHNAELAAEANLMPTSYFRWFQRRSEYGQGAKRNGNTRNRQERPLPPAEENEADGDFASQHMAHELASVRVPALSADSSPADAFDLVNGYLWTAEKARLQRTLRAANHTARVLEEAVTRAYDRVLEEATHEGDLSEGSARDSHHHSRRRRRHRVVSDALARHALLATDPYVHRPTSSTATRWWLYHSRLTRHPVAFHFSGGWKEYNYETYKYFFSWSLPMRMSPVAYQRNREVLASAEILSWYWTEEVAYRFTDVCGIPV